MAIVINDDHIIGMPPGTHISDDIMHNSMPVAEIHPHEPKFTTGMTVFTLDDKWGEYSKVVESHGFTVKRPLKVAFLADNFPTDSFTNEYGESFLQKFTDFGSQAVSDLSQMANVEDIDGFLKGMGKQEGMIGTIGKGAQSGMAQLDKLKKASGKFGGAMAGIAHTAAQIGTGGKVDFPQVWRSSGFTPSYSMTIRLYNPNPQNEVSHLKYIVGPICALLALVLPRSHSLDTYKWPFLHKIYCKGIYNLSPAFASNIAVVKGGDQQNIAWNQRLSIVDIRIDFGSLYNSIMIDESNDTDPDKRPTLSGYLKALKEGVDMKPYPYSSAPPGAKTSPTLSSVQHARNLAQLEQKQNQSKAVNQEPVNFDSDPPERALAGDNADLTSLTSGEFYA